MCPTEWRVEWYGGGLPSEAIRRRTDRIALGGVCGEGILGRRIRSGDGMIGERMGLSPVSIEGGLRDVIGLTGRLLTTSFLGGVGASD
jgi:hypothetical protein